MKPVLDGFGRSADGLLRIPVRSPREIVLEPPLAGLNAALGLSRLGSSQRLCFLRVPFSFARQLGSDPGLGLFCLAATALW